MPELPEVETTVRAINKFENKKLIAVIIHNRNLRWKVDKTIEKKIVNKKITKISRRAKYILIQFEDLYIMLHLGMSGNLRIQRNNNNHFKKHDHAEFVFKDEKIIFNDVRRFGSIHLTKNPFDHELIKVLGIEPLSNQFNEDYLYEVCKNSNLEIKKILMDQRKIVGVGNIYASESLFLSRISPERIGKKLSIKDCSNLSNSIKKVLKEAIKMGGTTLKDFYSADGNQGYFKIKLNVYGKDGQLCNSCNNIITKKIIGQRSTFMCSKCQN